ncbi:MAG: hypothetical protein ACKVJE_20360 [Pseudomonadales bacterium]
MNIKEWSIGNKLTAIGLFIAALGLIFSLIQLLSAPPVCTPNDPHIDMYSTEALTGVRDKLNVLLSEEGCNVMPRQQETCSVGEGSEIHVFAPSNKNLADKIQSTIKDIVPISVHYEPHADSSYIAICLK